jgi:hypothetical protein
MKGDIKMKKIIFAIAIVMTIGLTANAQSGTDGFFGNYNDNGYDNRDDISGTTPGLPTYLGNSTDSPAPLGTGLLVMTALGAGYAVAKRRKK